MTQLQHTLEALEAMLRQRPTDLRLHEVLARAYEQSGHALKALAHCDFILELTPNSPFAITSRARLMLELNAPPFELAQMGRQLIGLQQADARHWLEHILVRLHNWGSPPENLNLGGGGQFHHCGWQNLDGVRSPLNPRPFAFSPAMALPIADRSMRLVYSSHCIEHLDDNTVDRLLVEARRVLHPNGLLLLKIPEFEKTVERYKSGDDAYFDTHWNIGAMTSTWASRKLQVTIDAKAAAIFCGFWNDAYGQWNAAFQGNISHGPDAYHGPPVLPPGAYGQILTQNSPHQAAAQFRRHVEVTEPSYHFNHQNAWSRAELVALLQRHDFTALSTDSEEICRRMASVPTIREMFEISLYVLATRTGDLKGNAQRQ